MLPSNYNYSNNDPRVHTCANCEHRWVAFHLIAGTSFCNLHKYRTQASSFHCCAQWKEDTREKPTWTQNVGMAMRMPDMDSADFFTHFSLKGYCYSCKNCGRAGDFLYCNKYFEELEGQERTCKECQVGMFGRCEFWEGEESKK